MLKKFRAPYRFAPARISTARIDGLLGQFAQAQLDSSGRRGYQSVSMVTFMVGGQVADQFPVHGNVSSVHKFVASFNRAVAARR